MDDSKNDQPYSEEIFNGEIEGLSILHNFYPSKGDYDLTLDKDCAVFLIGLKGKGILKSKLGLKILEKESLVVIPNDIRSITISLDEDKPLHYLLFTKVYSDADKASFDSFVKPLNEFYTARFQECEPYTEKIKSPNTVSRTVLPKDIIPRVALGTVESRGPDKVGEHSHPMLEQIFIGLEDNAVTVFADEAKCEMGAFSLLHIPLGSTHCVEVAENCKMNYMWMDFFLAKDGEVWLNTHKPIISNDAE